MRNKYKHCALDCSLLCLVGSFCIVFLLSQHSIAQFASVISIVKKNLDLRKKMTRLPIREQSGHFGRYLVILFRYSSFSCGEEPEGPREISSAITQTELLGVAFFILVIIYLDLTLNSNQSSPL
jgi:hypothetical protein